MGEVVGAALLAHVPTIMLPEAVRKDLNNGQEISLVPGLKKLRKDIFETLDYDTVVVLDSHWATTVEFVITSAAERSGLFTSEELPRGMTQIPYSIKGDPELAISLSKYDEKNGTWVTPIADPHLPIFYATVNLWHYLGRGLDEKRWISMSVCQTGTPEDFIRAGRALGEAIRDSDRKVVLIASGALSHTFHKLRDLRKHEASDPKHIYTPEAYEYDLKVMEWFKQGNHAAVLDDFDTFRKYKPEAGFFHYLAMAGAVGEEAWTSRGELYSEYENSIGTGQVHFWFPKPEGGFPDPRTWCFRVTEFRRILLDGYPLQVVRDGDELVAPDGRRVAIKDAVHLPPSEPTKIVAVHLNYESRTKEFMTKLPPAPTYFLKPTTALNAHHGAVVRPSNCKWLNYEGEIVIIIGKTCRNISPAEAGEYIAGYSVGNDFGLHDFRDTDAGSMLRVKGSDTLAPVGPGMVTDWDFRNKRIQTIVNGKVVQDDNTANMEWDMHYLVADIARNITLLPGDMLYSGTPANSRPVFPGDVVEVEVEGLGRLTNTVVEGPIPIREDVGAQPTESEEVVSTALGGDWEFRGIRTPSKDLYPSTVEEK